VLALQGLKTSLKVNLECRTCADARKKSAQKGKTARMQISLESAAHENLFHCNPSNENRSRVRLYHWELTALRKSLPAIANRYHEPHRVGPGERFLSDSNSRRVTWLPEAGCGKGTGRRSCRQC
jgi:hypothetical protein